MPKPKRRRYRKLTLSEVSGVTTPAQEGALAEFAKSADVLADRVAKALLKLVPKRDETITTTKEAAMPEDAKKDGEQVVETYKSVVTGKVYATPGEIELAKQIDEQAATQAVEKRVGEEFGTVASKGDDAGKALATFVLKSGDAAAIKGLQAVETALAETTKQALGNLGTAIGGVAEPTEGVDQFVAKANEWGKQYGLIGSAAQVEFAKTDEGSAMLANSVAA